MRRREKRRRGGRRSDRVHTGNNPHATNPLLAFDAILQHARRGGLDGAPVTVHAGDGHLAGCVGVEEDGYACGPCSFPSSTTIIITDGILENLESGRRFEIYVVRRD